MNLTYAEALALHGAVVANPSYREGDNPDVDAALAKLERFIAGDPPRERHIAPDILHRWGSS